MVVLVVAGAVRRVVGMESIAEVECKLSDGVKSLEVKIKRPMKIRSSALMNGLLCCTLRRSEISALSIDCSAGDKRLLMGTQCVEWTSVGCRVKGGMSCRSSRKTKGHKTMRLAPNSRVSLFVILATLVRFERNLRCITPIGGDDPFREIAN